MAKATIDVVHEEYEEFAPVWKRMRDVIDGEDAVKTAGTEYLPILADMTEEEYAAYKSRAEFFNATARTLDGLTGMVFRKDARIVLENEKLKDPLLRDIDLNGEALELYAKNLVNEVIGLGRAGTLIDWEVNENRPYFAFYCAESILNWRESRIAGQSMTTLVTLHEWVELNPSVLPHMDGQELNLEVEKVEQVRILKLVNKVIQLGDIGKQSRDSFEYQVDVWQLLPVPGAKEKKLEWQFIATRIPTRSGKPLNFIPFVFHNATNSRACCCKPPLADIVSVNLHHYVLNAAYNHGLHFTALPTAWVAGFATDTELRIGSATAWVSSDVNAKAGFLEYSGQGLGAIEKALEKDERYMTVLGARLLEEQKADAETAETLRIRQGGESSILSNVSRSISEGLTKALRIAFWWDSTIPTVEEIDENTVLVTLNSDFLATKMKSADLMAMVDAWQRRAISRDTLHWNLVQGEMLPPGRTLEEEQAMIEMEAPVAGVLMPPPLGPNDPNNPENPNSPLHPDHPENPINKGNADNEK